MLLLADYNPVSMPSTPGVNQERPRPHTNRTQLFTVTTLHPLALPRKGYVYQTFQVGASQGVLLEVPETGHQKWINADPGSRWKSAWALSLCAPKPPPHLLQESMLGRFYCVHGNPWTVPAVLLCLAWSRQEYWRVASALLLQIFLNQGSNSGL